MPTFEVTAFGETMLRYSVPLGQRLSRCRQLDMDVGGAESNVLAGLAGLGRHCAWFGAVSDNDLGSLVLRELNATGMKTDSVIHSEHRLGKCYVEFASAPRSINVIYDRKDSAICHLSVADMPWDVLLDTSVLHLTGITPALSSSCAEIILEAVKRAQAKGVSVSFDINYRSKLWSPQKALAVLKPILNYVDILICGEGDALTVFGIKGSEQTVLEKLHDLSSAQHVVLTQSSRGSSTLLNGELIQVKAQKADIVDRIGAGDAFAAGVLDGFLDEDIVSGMKRGSVLSAIVLTQHGDMVTSSREEMQTLLNQKGQRLNR